MKENYSHLALILTNKCNLNCVYCLRKKTTQEISLSCAKKMLHQARKIGYNNVGLTGGDPFLYSGLKNLLLFLNQGGWKVLIETNGVLVNTGWVNFLRSLTQAELSFSVSLDSHDSRIHDAKRGRGSHGKAVGAINKLAQAGFPVRVIAVLTPDFEWRSEDVIAYSRLCKKIGVSSISIQSEISALPVQDTDKGASVSRSMEMLKAFDSKNLKIFTERKKKDLKCSRLDGKCIAVSAAGIHPCIFFERIILAGLNDFCEVHDWRLSSFFAFQRAALANYMDGEYDCSDCMRAVTRYMADVSNLIYYDKFSKKV